MLYVRFVRRDELKTVPNIIMDVDSTFDFLYTMQGKDAGWLDDQLIREAIRNIDHVDMNEEEPTYMSIFRAGFRPEDLATGTKNLVLCKFFDGYNKLASMGENCYPYLSRIASERDVYMAARINFKPNKEFFDYSSVCIVNNGHIYSTSNDWVESRDGVRTFLEYCD